LCWTAVALEGFDLVVLGVVLPTLLKEPSWGLTPNTASIISVVGLLGVMLGALAIGPVSDIIGRRKTMLLTVVSFSVFTLLCAFAPNPWIFGCCGSSPGWGWAACCPPRWR
jgi:MFS family permease